MRGICLVGGHPTAIIDSTFNFEGIFKASETYCSELVVSLCILSLICIQQLPSPIDSDAKKINVEAIEQSSIHMSDLPGTPHTTIPNGASFKGFLIHRPF